MTAARRRRWPRASFVALMPGALALGVWLSLAGGEAPPPAAAAPPAADAGASEVEAAAEDLTPARARAPTEDAAGPRVGTGTITGVLLDAGGLPVPHKRVFCGDADGEGDEGGAPSSVTSGQDGPGEKSAWTDRAGRFEFAEVVAGARAVFVVSRRDVRADVELAPGARCEVTLRLPEDLVAVRVELSRAGAPVEGAFLDFSGTGDKFWRRARLFDGVATELLRPGRYGIKLLPRHDAEPARLTVDAIVVPAGVPRHPFYVSVLGADVAVSLEPEGEVEIGPWQVVASACIDGEDVTVARQSEGRHRPVFRFLPPGEWTLRVVGDGLIEMPPQLLAVAPSDAELSVTIPARAGACVHLDVLGDDGYRLRAPPEFLPELYSAGCAFACRGTEKDPHYPGVPAGEVAIRCVDRVTAAEVAFLPFDEQEDVRAVVRVGAHNVVTLRGARRAHVDLRVCERGGREWRGATIAVFAGARRVRSLPVDFSQRFAAWLPAGDYRVVADRGGARKEYRVTVGRERLRLRLRP